MKIYRPLKTLMRTQGFGENKLPFYKELGMRGHNGEDWLCYKGEPIYHSGDFEGTAQTEVDHAGGIGVDVFSKDKQENLGLVKLRYWHLQKVVVYDGQKILPGQLIGYGDSTGLSTGDHLHWSLKQVDSKGKTLNKGNGYRGAIDFSPWFTPSVFILDKLGTKPKSSIILQLLVKLLSLAISGLKRGLLSKKQAKEIQEKVAEILKQHNA